MEENIPFYTLHLQLYFRRDRIRSFARRFPRAAVPPKAEYVKCARSTRNSFHYSNLRARTHKKTSTGAIQMSRCSEVGGEGTKELI